MQSRELRFTVWQFVRLMVHLEETPKHSARDGQLLAAWADVWTPLDAELARLAASDADAYGEMMMDQDVVIATATDEQIAAAQAALDAVVGEMDALIEAEAESDMLDSLKFERRELHKLARKLGRHLK